MPLHTTQNISRRAGHMADREANVVWACSWEPTMDWLHAAIATYDEVVMILAPKPDLYLRGHQRSKRR